MSDEAEPRLRLRAGVKYDYIHYCHSKVIESFFMASKIRLLGILYKVHITSTCAAKTSEYRMEICYVKVERYQFLLKLSNRFTSFIIYGKGTCAMVQIGAFSCLANGVVSSWKRYLTNPLFFQF